MQINIPALSLVALVGVSGSGKSTFARKHFKPTEVLSSDTFRGLISDDENNQAVTKDAFDALYYVAGKRLKLGLLTVVDATHTQRDARAALLELAREHDCHAAAIVLNVPEGVCRERNSRRTDRNFGAHVIKRQSEQLRKSIRHLKKEGFRFVYVLNDMAEIEGAEIVRTPLWNDKRDERGPFDIIGDVHGCYDELCELLTKLGYDVDAENFRAVPPSGRRAIFLGDLCDRGPKNPEVLRLVMEMVRSGNAYCVAGNHDVKLARYLKGGKVSVTHGLDVTIEQISRTDEAFRAQAASFLDSLISHYVFDDGGLVVAHAGLKEKFHGRASKRVRNFCLYGETTGETDEYGLPVRTPWAEDYRGRAAVVYGHTPSPEVQRLNRAVCIDTGCVFGGHLTCFRYPENECVQVAARAEYYAPEKPLAPEKGEDRQNILDIDDVMNKRLIETRYGRSVKIEAENAAAALEVMSRFAVDPRWLIYLPPTMSPCETSADPEYLEHPNEAFAYYKGKGVERVVCERKHMGSRAVIVLCEDERVARERFGATDGAVGTIYTRTGRPFFAGAEGRENERTLLERLRRVLENSGFWRDYATDWICLDTELMPWSAKAGALIREQYAAVGSAGRHGLAFAIEAIKSAETLHNSPDLTALLSRFGDRKNCLDRFTEAYGRYCWDVKSIDDYRVAPFHVMATEGHVWHDENHVTHMETIKKYMTGGDPVFVPTPYIEVETANEVSIAEGVKWWRELTGEGYEGMVVKSLDFMPQGGGNIQPALKCRGHEYLRLIYGPEYDMEGNLKLLKQRTLAKKRKMATSEFLLGMEALEHFAAREPLYRVHECVFGVLAMESEPVDSRL